MHPFSKLTVLAPGRENWLTQWPIWISHFMISPGTGDWPGCGGRMRAGYLGAGYMQNISFSCRQLWTWLLLFMRSMRCGLALLTAAVGRSRWIPLLAGHHYVCRLPFISFPCPCCVALRKLLNSLSFGVCQIRVSTLDECFRDWRCHEFQQKEGAAATPAHETSVSTPGPDQGGCC